MSSNATDRLVGKRVLITGTGGGQGEAAQHLFVKEGAAEATAGKPRDEGYDVSGSTVDLSDPEQADAWVRESAKPMGGLDVRCNNAAGSGFALVVTDVEPVSLEEQAYAEGMKDDYLKAVDSTITAVRKMAAGQDEGA